MSKSFRIDDSLSLEERMQRLVQLKQLKGPMTDELHLKCLSLVKIHTPNWESYESPMAYADHLENHMSAIRHDLEALMQYDHSLDSAKQRILFTPELEEEAKERTDLVDFIMTHLYPEGPLQVIPPKHAFKDWFIKQEWPSNVSFKPFQKQCGQYKVNS